MSKIALALKYRPKTFSDVVEQDAIKQTIQHQIDTNTLKNCYLFTGPAGCGKTTNARILANDINSGKGTPYELDAASNNSVDDMRHIIELAKYKPVDCDYKVFILDECFYKNTKVKTINGNIPISDINIGDIIYNLSGIDIVEDKFINKVNPNRLTKVTLSNGKEIITTKEHLFFTADGWKETQNLVKGDILYDYSYLSYMWKNFFLLSKRYKENLFQRMWQDLSQTDTTTTQKFESIDEDMSNMRENIQNISFDKFNYLWCNLRRYLQTSTWLDTETKRFICEVTDSISVSSMWKNYDRDNIEKSKILFKRMCQQVQNNSETTEIGFIYGMCMCYMWENIFKTVFEYSKDLFKGMYEQTAFSEMWPQMFRETTRTNAFKQSFNEPRNSSENETNQREEWNITPMDWKTWWKWSIYGSTDGIIQFIRHSKLETGMCSTHKDEKGFWISNELQNRHRQSKSEIGYRSGWPWSFWEKITSTGLKEDYTSGNTWVENIEIYQRGNNEQSFASYFTDTELHSDFIELYDLQIKNHPSYIVEDVLVHNCHSFSNAAWQAFLKLCEEPPAHIIFLLCTTDPQKIPNTILSRVQRYDFKKISFKGIVNRLNYIIEQENKEGANVVPTQEGIEYIAKLADGGMRDSITTLDKCISYNSNLTLENVVKALGGVNYDTMFDLAEAIYNFDASTAITITETIYSSGANIKQFVKDFSNFVLDLCKYGLLGSFEYLYIPSYYSNRVAPYNREHFAFFNQLLGELIKLNTTIKWEGNPKPVIESIFILLCQKA